jgi:hypothetical protein
MTFRSWLKASCVAVLMLFISLGQQAHATDAKDLLPGTAKSGDVWCYSVYQENLGIFQKHVTLLISLGGEVKGIAQSGQLPGVAGGSFLALVCGKITSDTAPAAPAAN